MTEADAQDDFSQTDPHWEHLDHTAHIIYNSLVCMFKAAKPVNTFRCGEPMDQSVMRLHNLHFECAALVLQLLGLLVVQMLVLLNLMMECQRG